MSLFTDEAAVYGAFGKLFSDVIADEKTRGALLRTNTIVQFQLRDPRATVTVAVRQGQEPLIYFGPTTRRPELHFQLSAETAHDWFRGELNPTIAFGNNAIKTRGPSGQVLAVIAWAKVLVPAYKAILEANGGELPPPLAPPIPEPVAEAAPAAEEGAAAAPAEGADAAEAPAEEGAVAEEAPAEEAAPAAEEAPAEEPAPVADPAPAEEVPAEEPAPAEEETPAEEPALAEEETPAEEPAPAAEEAPAEEPAPTEEPAPAADKPEAAPAVAAAEEAAEPATDPAPEDEAPAGA